MARKVWDALNSAFQRASAALEGIQASSSVRRNGMPRKAQSPGQAGGSPDPHSSEDEAHGFAMEGKEETGRLGSGSIGRPSSSCWTRGTDSGGRGNQSAVFPPNVRHQKAPAVYAMVPACLLPCSAHTCVCFQEPVGPVYQAGSLFRLSGVSPSRNLKVL